MEDRVRALEDQVLALRERLAALESRQGPAPAAEALPVASTPEAEPARPTTAAPADLGQYAALAGRTLLVFGGAFLIRALVSRGALPHGVGAGVGLAFATLWAGAAWFEVARGRTASAQFHALAAVLVGFPLIVETTARLGALSPPVAAGVTVAFTAVLLVPAIRHRQRWLAWFGGVGSLVTLGALLRATAEPTPFLCALLLLGAASLFLEVARDWNGLRWFVAPLLNVFVLAHLLKTLRLQEEVAGTSLMQPLLLIAVTVAMFVIAVTARTWLRSREVGAFEIVQTILVLGLGLGAVLRIREAAPGLMTVTGAIALALAAGALLGAAQLSRDPVRGADTWFYGVTSLALLLAGGLMFTRSALLGLLWAGMGLAAAIFGRRRQQLMLWAFAAVLSWAAAGAAGLLSQVTAAMRSGNVGDLSWETAVAAGLVAMTYAAMMARGAEGERVQPRLLAGAVLLLALLGGAGLGLSLGHDVLGGGPFDDEALVALLWTLALAAAALVVALARRLRGPAELSWVACILVALSGLALLTQDLRVGTATTQFIAFLSVGLALVLMTRLLKPPARLGT